MQVKLVSNECSLVQLNQCYMFYDLQLIRKIIKN